MKKLNSGPIGPTFETDGYIQAENGMIIYLSEADDYERRKKLPGIGAIVRAEIKGITVEELKRLDKEKKNTIQI